MKLNEKQDVIMMKDNVGDTPLHCVARSNKLEICKELLGITDNITDSLSSFPVIRMMEEKNARGQTALLVACEMGYIEIVKCFWNAVNKIRKPGELKRDDDRKSCLHLAAAKGKHISKLKDIK